MKFIATTSDRVANIPQAAGQLIFSRDDRTIYLDTEDRRDEFRTIIRLDSEAARQVLTPVKGYYFVEDTATLWFYNGSDWTQLTTPPTEQIVFDKRENFPVSGNSNKLYVDGTKIYM